MNRKGARQSKVQSHRFPGKRCAWCGDDPVMIRYHDKEWGTPLHDDRRLFELLVLEGAQAGLSWRTILHKRGAYRKAFRNFVPKTVAGFSTREIQRLLKDPGIVRNRAKIASAITNARAFLRVRKEFGSFDTYVWSFVNGRPIRRNPRTRPDVPMRSAESDALSADLRTRGFSFVGSTICYAFLQSAGLVDDQTADCFRRKPRQTR